MPKRKKGPGRPTDPTTNGQIYPPYPSSPYTTQSGGDCGSVHGPSAAVVQLSVAPAGSEENGVRIPASAVIGIQGGSLSEGDWICVAPAEHEGARPAVLLSARFLPAPRRRPPTRDAANTASAPAVEVSQLVHQSLFPAAPSVFPSTAASLPLDGQLAAAVSLRHDAGAGDRAEEMQRIEVSFITGPKKSPNKITGAASLADRWKAYDLLRLSQLHQQMLKEAFRSILFPSAPGAIDPAPRVLPYTLLGQEFYLQIRCVPSEDGGDRVFRVGPRTCIEFLAPTLSDGAADGGEKKQLEGSTMAALGFAQVGGLHRVVAELRTYCRGPLLFPELYGRLGVKPPKGVLLYGPPGTGKTLLARALCEDLTEEAESMGLPLPHLETVTASELLASGTPEARIGAIFAAARSRSNPNDSGVRSERNARGTLLVIDEIDALCPRREVCGEESRRFVSAFLAHLDGLETHTRLVLLGTSNQPQSIDSALRRSGRLDIEIEVGVPNDAARAEIVHKVFSRMPHSLTAEQLTAVVENTQAFVGADIAALAQKAAMRALEDCQRAQTGKFPSANPDFYEDADRENAGGADGCCDVQWRHVTDALRTTIPSAMRELIVDIPTTRWDSIGGYESAKQQLKESVEWPLKHGDVFRKLHLSPPKGVLLFGPPGCSKTLLAKAVSCESRMNFISVKGPALFSKYVGESERAVRDLFRKARQNAPCVIFLDEVDAIGSNRQSGGGAGGVENRVLAQILTEMDGVGVSSDVVVIGATNRPDILDAALLRPGRFDRMVYIPLPDLEARVSIFRVHTRDLPLEARDEELLYSLAELAAGRSGAEIAAVCKETAIRQFRNVLRSGVEVTGEVLSRITIKQEGFETVLRERPSQITADMVSFYEKYASASNITRG